MNKAVKYAIAGAAALTMSLSSYAVITVNWGSQDATPYTLADGSTLVPQGDLIEVGYFSTTAGLTTLNTAVQNLANFTSYATGAVGDGFAFDGFAGEDNDVSGWGFQHQQIYLVAFNASTAAAATQMGVWSVTFGSANANQAGWRFPSDSDIPNDTSVDMDDLTLAPGTADGALATGANIWLGTGTTADGNGGMDLAQLVPEPSTYMLVGTGLIGLLAIRRRRS